MGKKDIISVKKHKKITCNPYDIIIFNKKRSKIKSESIIYYTEEIINI